MQLRLHRLELLLIQRDIARVFRHVFREHAELTHPREHFAHAPEEAVGGLNIRNRVLHIGRGGIEPAVLRLELLRNSEPGSIVRRLDDLRTELKRLSDLLSISWL